MKGYLTVAQDSKFAQSEHRKEALGLTASILDNDQHTRARPNVQEVLRIGRRQTVGQREAYFFACNAYEKANNTAHYNRLPKDFINRSDKTDRGRRVHRAGLHDGP